MKTSIDSPEFDLEAALAEAETKETSERDDSPRLADDVILDLAYRALEGNEDVTLANSGLMGLRGRDGIKVTVDDKGSEPRVTLDAYVNVRYGVRIPDVAWDVQEKLKRDLERVTGYEIKAVNIHVQGVIFPDEREA